MPLNRRLRIRVGVWLQARVREYGLGLRSGLYVGFVFVAQRHCSCSIRLVAIYKGHAYAFFVFCALPRGGWELNPGPVNHESSTLTTTRRLFRYGYTSTLLNIEDLLADADETLFIKVLRPGHCLQQLLPEHKLVSVKLRPSNHSCQLPICKYVSYKRSVIVRCLFNYVWKCSCCISLILLLFYFLYFRCAFDTW